MQKLCRLVPGHAAPVWRSAIVLLAPVIVAATPALSQPVTVIPGPNVNMVSGTTWPDGDPFLQRQNEPSLAVSTRNPIHLLAGANDYRTVDLPGLPEGRETGDSWLGVFESGDGGGSWTSTLIPCYPQADPGACMGSPIFGYEAAADPVVRAGTHGLFYYSGIVFDRGTPARSAAFVARFMDLNNDTADPIQYVDTVLVDSDPGGEFIDKTWLEVDVPRSGAQTVTLDVPQGDATVSQEVQCGNVYLAWAAISGEGATLRTNIMFSRSLDCGGTWSAPVPLSGDNTVSQGATIAIAPDTGNVHVAWRQFETPPSCSYPRLWWTLNLESWPVREITVGGVTYDQAAARELLRFLPISTPHTVARQLVATRLNLLRGADDAVIRDTAQAADAWLVQHPVGSRPDRAARREGLAFAVRLFAFNVGQIGPGSCFDSGLASEDAVVACTSTDGGQSFSPPTIVAALSPFDQGTSELSFRTNAYPTMAVDETGRVYLAWSTRGLAVPNGDVVSGDSRIVVATSADGATWTAPRPMDQPGVAGHQIFPSLTYNAGKLVMVYDDFRTDASEIFEPYVVDLPERPLRHTVDVRAAIADPGIAPEFTDYSVLAGSHQVSRYPLVVTGSGAGDAASRQLQWNPPNLPMFALGTRPFFADYLDVAGAPRFVSSGDGTWGYNTAPSAAPVFHAVWTDNRDVVGPPDGDWTGYIPPGDGTPRTSVFDGASAVPTCDPDTDFDRTQMRNQNIYTSRLTSGLFVAVPANSRPLTTDFSRAFVVFVQNATGLERTYRLSILDQPVGGSAVFSGLALIRDATIGAYSSTSEVVFVRSSDPMASVDVRVREIGDCESDGTCLEATARVNPDSSNPPPADPALAADEYYNPAVLNPAVHNPAVYNPAVLNETVYNPAVFNLDPSNPAVLNYDAANPAVYNPAVLNPAVYNSALLDEAFNLAMMALALANPAVFNPAVLNPAVLNPAVLNPAVFNPAVLNPAVLNPAVFNPAVLNPAVLNPAVLNPAVLNPAVLNSTITEAHFVARNAGNAPMAYSFNVRLQDQPEGLLYQLLIYRLYFTPVANGCELTGAAQHQLVVNDLDPNVFANLLEPDDGAAFYLNPDEFAVATLRVFPDPDAAQPGDPADFNAGGLSVSVVSHAPNPGGGGGVGDDQPPFDDILGSDVDPLTITTSTLPDGVMGSPYPATTLAASGGSGTRTWSVAPGSALPAGLLLSTSGVLSGVPTGSGSFGVVIRVTDETQLAERTFTVDVLSGAAPLHFAYQGIVDNTDGAPDSAPFDAFIGETIRVEYTFDPSTPDTNGSGNGDYPGAVLGLTVTVGPYVYTASSGTIIVRNEPPGPDQYEVDVPVGLSGPAIGGIPVDRIQIILSDSSQTYFSSDALPTVPPQPAEFDSQAIQLQFWDPGVMPEPYGLIQATNVVIASGLTFVTQPVDSVAGEAMPGVSVELRDGSGAVLPGVNITMALGASPCSDASIGGIVTASTDGAGVATFDGLSVDSGGGGYTLQASLTGNPAVNVTSQAFDVLGFCPTGSPGVTPAGVITATLLPDGRVLLAGGVSAASASLYDPATGALSTTGSMVTPRQQHAATLLPTGKVLVTGGNDGYTILDAAEIYDPATGAFTSAGAMSSPHTVHTSTLLPDGRVLIVGRGGEPAELYDPVAGTFTEIAPPAGWGGRHTATLLPSGDVLIAGGEGGTNQARLYDLLTNTFSATGSMAVSRLSHTATLLPDGKVLVAGGWDGSESVGSLELYDPETGSFSTSEAAIVPRHVHGATLLPDGRVLLDGGTSYVDGGPGLAMTEAAVYEPQTDAIVHTVSARSPRNQHTTTLLPNGTVLLVGGGYTPAAELFLSFPPDTFTVTNTDDAGGGSLRQAILDANANPGRDLIAFDIPGSPPHTIAPGSALPTVTDPLVLDATTQPGFAGTPVIEIDGSSAGTDINGLYVTAGSSTVRGFAINRFDGSGIFLLDRGRNLIEGNYVGTDPTGALDLGNLGGVTLFASVNNVIGGLTPAARNVVSGNTGSGIFLSGDGNVVQGNFVGTDASGASALGNDEYGVFVVNGHANNLIGGTQPGAGNVISDNLVGVSIHFNNTRSTRVQGNLIGTDASGTVDLGNETYGVWVAYGPRDNLVGGTDPAARNVISGNDRGGIELYLTSGNEVQGNLIGTDISGTLSLGNGWSGGVIISDEDSGDSSNNVVGGLATGAGNVIAFNEDNGISLHTNATGVSASIGNRFQGNRIHSNSGLGIDLAPNGVNPNDPGDGDVGVNNLQNSPVVTAAGSPGSVTQVYFGIESEPNTAYTVEFFHSLVCDPSGFGEGETPFGSWGLLTDGTGVAGDAFFSSASIPPGSFVTAIATDPDGNSSEFSQCVQELPAIACAPGCASAPDFSPCDACGGACTVGVCISGTCTIGGAPQVCP